MSKCKNIKPLGLVQIRYEYIHVLFHKACKTHHLKANFSSILYLSLFLLSELLKINIEEGRFHAYVD